jgi:DNA-3-methyladenine glycosylase II
VLPVPASLAPRPSLTLEIPLPAPFHVGRTIGFLRTSSLRTPYRFMGPRRLRRLAVLWHRLAMVEFTFLSGSARPGGSRPAGRPRLVLRVWTAGRAEAAASAAPARALARAVWSLDDDLRSCARALTADPLLAPLVQRCRGLRMVRTPDLYEALLIAVAGQQISVAAAESTRRRLIDACGARTNHDGVAYCGYPFPERLAAVPPPRLAALGLSRQKAHYIGEIARAAAAGRLDGTAFDGVSDEEAVARLTALPGVGRWTAEIALMRGLPRPDVFPAADLGLQVALQRLTGAATRLGEAEARALAERWRGWRSYAALYLWSSLHIAA